MVACVLFVSLVFFGCYVLRLGARCHCKKDKGWHGRSEEGRTITTVVGFVMCDLCLCLSCLDYNTVRL